MEDNARPATIRPNAWHMLGRTGSFAGWTDGQLLGRFAESQGRDEVGQGAFETLVERHGAAVLRVCRAVLRDAHEADDAFQATFLVLARRARSIRNREAVGAWLLGVAYRVAGCARAARIRRAAHERRAASSAGPYTDSDSDEPNDWVPLLREEIAGLPEKFRLPLVLCYLDGLPQDEVARRLDWPIGTVRSRLARGRDRLRRRLILRGVTPAIAATAVTTWRESVAASSPFPRAVVNWTVESLANSAMGPVSAARSTSTATIGAATATPPVIALTREVLRTMFWTKMRLHAAAWLTAGLLVAATGFVAGRAGAYQDPRSGEERNAQATATPKAKASTTAMPPGSGHPLTASENLLVYEVIVDRLKAADLGLTPRDIKGVIAAAFELPEPMTHRMVWTNPDDDRVIFVRKQTPDGAFISFDRLLNVSFLVSRDGRAGRAVPLRNVATIRSLSLDRLRSELEACVEEFAAAEAGLKQAEARARRARASLVAARDRLKFALDEETAPSATSPGRPAAKR